MSVIRRGHSPSAVADPIVPIDGDQDITGDLSVSGDVEVSGDVTSGADVILTGANGRVIFDGAEDSDSYLRRSGDGIQVWSSGVFIGQFTSSGFTYNSGDLTMASGGQILADDGAAGAPSYSFASDTDTGMWYASGSGRIVFTNNTNEVLQLYQGGNQMAVALNVTSYVQIGDQDQGTTARSNGLLNSTDLQVGNTDVPGSDLTIRPGIGSGAGDVGTLIFQTPRVEASGTTLQTPTTILTLDEDQAIFATGTDVVINTTPLNAYGGIWFSANSTPATQDVANTFELLTTWDNDFTGNGVTGDSTTDNEVTVTNAGTYEIKFHCSLSGTASGELWEFAIYHGADGAEAIDYSAVAHRESSTTTLGNCGCFTIASLAAGDNVQVWVKCDSGTDRTLTVHNAGLIVTALGE